MSPLGDRLGETMRDPLHELEGVRIREFVPVLTWRRARARLRGSP